MASHETTGLPSFFSSFFSLQGGSLSEARRFIGHRRESDAGAVHGELREL